MHSHSLEMIAFKFHFFLVLYKAVRITKTKVPQTKLFPQIQFLDSSVSTKFIEVFYNGDQFDSKKWEFVKRRN